MHGFSLLESILVLMLVAIFSLSMYPSCKILITYSHHLILQATLQHALDASREFALKEKMLIGLGVCDDLSDQQKTLLLIFHDDGSLHSPCDAKKIFDRIPLTLYGGHLVWHHFLHTRSYLRFFPNHEGADNGSISYCRANDQDPYFAMVINRIGVSHLSFRNSDGKIQDERGKNIQCVSG